MATRKSSRGSGGSFGGFLLGFLCAGLLAAAGGWAYLHFGHHFGHRHNLGHLHVVAVNPAHARGSTFTKVPPAAPLDHKLQQPPFGVSEDVYEAGAHIYKQQCAACHGSPGRDVTYGQRMNPPALQLWKKRTSSNIVGVSDDQPSEIFWEIKNGIRLSGMPSYKHVLSDDQIWDVSLLLQNSGQEMPDPVLAILRHQ